MEERLQNTTWEPLCGGARVLVSPQHTFGTDAVLLAHFAAPRPRERWADLGTGCGVIPLLWRVRTQAGAITGVEMQEKAAWQAQRSVEENGFSATVDIVQGDARQLGALFPAGSLDGIACNPPYTAPGAGIPSEDGARRAARQGDSLSLEDVARGARYALRFGGRLCLCLRPQRLAEAVEVFHSHQLEPKRLRLVQQRAGKAPFLFLLDGIEDPHNLGAIIRTANLAGAHGVIIPKRRAVGLTATVAKTSAGALNYTPVAKVTNLTAVMEDLKKKGLWFVCADMGGDVMYRMNLTGPIGLVIGNEGEGVSKLVREHCDMTASIPMKGDIDSLNASVAAGVLAYEIVRQRLAK